MVDAAQSICEENPPVLQVREISKTFDGAIHALKGVSITIDEGEIVGVLGENGAGKSTLMKILGGVYAPDRGEWLYRGRREPFPSHAREAAERGIAVVHQERGIIPSLRAYEYLFLGYERLKSPRLRVTDIRAMRKQAAEILHEFGIDLDPDAFLYDVAPPVLKMVEIARAVSFIRSVKTDAARHPIVILDEPTAPLSPEDRDQLFRYIRGLKGSSSFILVTHNLQEALTLCDRVYVLRDGRHAAEYSLRDGHVTERDLVVAVTGAQARPGAASAVPPAGGSREVVLQVQNLSRARAYAGISFELRRGECLGLYGPRGCGKSEVLRTLAGLMRFDQGTLIVRGQQAAPGESVRRRLDRGVGYFTGETEKELFFNLPVGANISMVNLRRITQRLGVLNLRQERAMAERVIERLQVKAAHPRGYCRTLSGGNKQKVSLARWLERKPELLLLENPTTGVDVGARQEIYQALQAMKQEGISLILVSDDTKEYLALCDQVLVMRDGGSQGLVDAATFAEVVAS